jgi:hypothetical protein
MIPNYSLNKKEWREAVRKHVVPPLEKTKGD